MKRLLIPRAAFERDREKALSDAVDATLEGLDDPTPAQAIVVLGLEYLQGIMMDGHALYFENRGLDEADRAVDALDVLGARVEHGCLTDALALFRSTGNGQRTADDLSSRLRESLAAIDQRMIEHASSSTSLERLLSRYVEQRLDEFIDLV